MGVSSVDWFSSYLSDRKQIVNVNDVDSNPLGVSCGVPQGSILGPLLFLCYVNDMASSVDCKLLLYADDSALLVSDKNPGHIAERLGGHEKGLMGILAPLYHAWRGKAFTKLHEYLLSCAKEYGPIFRQKAVDMGWVVNISDADDLEKVFRAAGKFPNRPLVKPWNDHRQDRNFNVGLFTSEGETWQKLRSAVSPGISKPSAIVSHVGSMHEVALDLINKLRSIRKPDGVIPDIETELYKWAVESPATFFFDKRLDLITERVLKKENQEFFDALQVLAKETAKFFFLPAEVLNNLPKSRNPILKCDKSWDVLFAISKCIR
ncbi:1,25-dihydroxyvitamin D(3) 24-hydroxylase, mitochondrial-like [Amphiura filiformis]|uniref:1,25-dihydroxyvitamin D(3) 24-hydroxylase, mitochondrial-like n=1 Tax=Amphiura filiformis TaxID=82378 RepID=UPI003B218151